MVIRVGLNHWSPLDAIIIDQKKDEIIRNKFIDMTEDNLKEIVSAYGNKRYLTKLFYNFLDIFGTPNTLRKYRVAKKVLEERTKTD